MKAPAGIKRLDDKASHLIIGLMRVVVGTLWLANLEWKRPRDFGFKAKNGLYKYVDSAVRNPVLGVHKYFIQHVVLPNYTFFGWVTLFTEVALAVTLILGWHRASLLWSARSCPSISACRCSTTTRRPNGRGPTT